MEPSSKQYDLDEVLAHAGWVRALARQLLADEHRAEDAAQEAMRVALERRPRSGPGLKAWLGRVVRNVAFNQRREEARRFQREQRVAGAQEQRRHDPESRDLSAWAEQMQAIVAAVESLEEPFRQTLKLRYFEELSPTEIAQHLGVPAATVRTRLKRGLERLRVQLRATWGDDRYLGCLVGLVQKSLPQAAALGPLITVGRLAAGLMLVTGAAFAWVLWSDPGETHPARMEPAAVTAEGEPFVVEAPDPERMSSDRIRSAAMSDAAVDEYPVRVRVVRGSDAEPVPGAQVFVMPSPLEISNWDEINAESLGHVGGVAEKYGRIYTSDQDGEVTVLLEDSTWRFMFAKSDGFWGQVQWDGSKADSSKCDIRLYLDANYSARVVDIEGEPVEGIPIGIGFARPDEFHSESTGHLQYSDAEGLVHFRHVGALQRQSSDRGARAFARIELPLKLTEFGEARPMGQDPVELIVPSLGQVEVTVVNAEGQIQHTHPSYVRLQRKATAKDLERRPTAPGMFQAVPGLGFVDRRVENGAAVFTQVGLDCELEMTTTFGRGQASRSFAFLGPTRVDEVIQVTLREPGPDPKFSVRLLDESGQLMRDPVGATLLFATQDQHLVRHPIRDLAIDDDGVWSGSLPGLGIGQELTGCVAFTAIRDGAFFAWKGPEISVVNSEVFDWGELQTAAEPVVAGRVEAPDGHAPFPVKIYSSLQMREELASALGPLRRQFVSYLIDEARFEIEVGNRFAIYLDSDWIQPKFRIYAQPSRRQPGLERGELGAEAGKTDLLIKLQRETRMRGRLLLDPGMYARLVLERMVPRFNENGDPAGWSGSLRSFEETGEFECHTPSASTWLTVRDRETGLLITELELPALEQGEVVEVPPFDLRGKLVERALSVQNQAGDELESVQLIDQVQGQNGNVGVRTRRGNSPLRILMLESAKPVWVHAQGMRYQSVLISQPSQAVTVTEGFPIHVALTGHEDLSDRIELKLRAWPESVPSQFHGVKRMSVPIDANGNARLPFPGAWNLAVDGSVRFGNSVTSKGIGSASFFHDGASDPVEATVAIDLEAVQPLLARAGIKEDE